MGLVRAIRVALRLVKEVGEDDLSGAASELAYKFFLALFPFFIFLAALGGFASGMLQVSNPTDEVMDLIGNSLPADAASLLREQVDTVVQSKDPVLLSIGIIGAIWAASSGMGTIMKAMNRVYEVKETRPLLKRYGTAVGLTLLAGGFIVVAFVLLVAVQIYGQKIAEAFNAGSQTRLVFSIARWPIALALMLAAIAFLLSIAPNIDLPFKWISPGAMLFVAVWLPATYLFGLYVANFGSYSDTYGALGGVVVLLIWLYLTSFILLLAAELNSVLAQEGAPRELEARAGQGATARTASGGKASTAQPQGDEDGSSRRTPSSLYTLIAGGFLALIAIWSTAIKSRLSR